MRDRYVRVRVGDEQYALAVAHVLEIVVYTGATPVPGAPPAVLGLQNLRGEVVAVLDLGSAIGRAPQPAPERVVIAQDAGRRCGLAVDEVLAVGRLPALRSDPGPAYTHAHAVVGDEIVGVIDVPALLGDLGPGAGA